MDGEPEVSTLLAVSANPSACRRPSPGERVRVEDRELVLHVADVELLHGTQHAVAVPDGRHPVLKVELEPLEDDRRPDDRETMVPTPEKNNEAECCKLKKIGAARFELATS